MIFATGNRHKLRELRELLPGVELEPLPDDVTLPPEEGDSFAEIALEKARATHEATGKAVVADDSGIGAVGIDGRPGIHSARYGGEGATRRTWRSCCVRSRPPETSAAPITPAPLS